MTVRNLAIRIAAGIVALAGVAACADSPLHVRTLFKCPASSVVLLPLAVVVDSLGNATSGTLKVDMGSDPITYTIDISASGPTTKIVYPRPSETMFGFDGSTHITLTTPLGDYSVALMTQSAVTMSNPNHPRSVSGQVLFIGAAASPPTLSRAENEGPSGKAGGTTYAGQLSTADPTLLPDRLNGYDGVTCVLLGPGSSRMSDASVAVLKKWIVSGGRVAFVKGLSTDALEDGRWSGILPGSPKPGTTTVREYGTGVILRFGFNPLSMPVDGGRAFGKALDRVGRFFGLRAAALGDQGPGRGAGTDLFSFELPSGALVTEILFAYLIVAVPINFGILRKIKRGELAWITTPLISLGFAGAFFLSARQLYDVSLLRRTRGMLAMQSGESTAVFTGSIDMYFPKAGTVNLKLDGLDRIFEQTTSPNGEVVSPPANEQDLNLRDDGYLKADRVKVGSLSFRSFEFLQDMDAPAIRVQTSPSSPGKELCTITNSSGLILWTPVVSSRGHVYQMADLSPGATDRIEIATTPDASAAASSNTFVADSSAALRRMTYQVGSVALSASVDAKSFGPRIGTEAAGGGRVTIVCGGEARK